MGLKKTSPILFSGIKPTGELHLGNYLGAIQNWAGLQDEYQCYYSIVNYHALTVPRSAEELRKRTMDCAIDLLAAGIDPKKSVLFVQSDVPEHAELSWIFSCLIPIPELERMTQYKDMVRDHKKTANAGMLMYPVLQAADISLYRAERVPVGQDQLQHLELSRIIARKFNRNFSTDLFPDVQPILPKQENARIMSLSNPSKKMSKSLGPNSYIALADSPDVIRKKIAKAVTDSGTESTTLTGGHNLLVLYRAFADSEEYAARERAYKLGSLSYADLKKDLSDKIVAFLAPIQEKQTYYRSHTKEVESILSDGAERARAHAQKTMAEVRSVTGLTYTGD